MILARPRPIEAERPSALAPSLAFYRHRRALWLRETRAALVAGRMGLASLNLTAAWGYHDHLMHRMRQEAEFEAKIMAAHARSRAAKN